MKMGTHDQRLSIAARCLTVGGFFLGAAAVFHLLAASHIPMVLKRVLDPKTYAFLEPIVSFTFLLNAVLLLPLSFSTLYCAAAIRRGEPWARWIGLANALTVLALPCLLVWSMGLRYFADAPLFLAGALSVAIAGLLMILPLLWAWRDIESHHDQRGSEND
ncbi:MAG TPA: hypothetical protein VOA87_11315 [Thermoanaerobaculia bacterium]|nr:hypothetical protein [Thermoanaerobaculia bacterium]